MSFILKDNIHRILADSVYSELLARRSNYYYFVGKVIDWADTNNPETPTSTSEYEDNTRKGIISVKKINIRDVSYVVPRRDWATGTVYDQYDGNYSASNPAYSEATSLKDSNFYVLTSSYGVYKCLYNNDDSPSTIEPSGTDLAPSTYGDGYVWKFLYTIPLSSRNRFLTEDYMPVLRAVNSSFYSNGEISSVIVDNHGSGYRGNAEVVLTVSGAFLGKPGNSICNLTPVLSTSGQFLDVVIDSQGNNYSNATIAIVDNLGSGTSYYNALSNVSITNTGNGYTTAARTNTTITLTTTGASQPTSNAKLTPVFSTANNTLVGVNILSAGSGYTTAVKSNTTVVISTTGATQPTTNATATAYYNTTAVLTPVILNGRVDRVLINDPGINYSANNQTIITTIGDGSGAVLTPFINSAGELADIIIESRGSGYTYLDIEIVGDGANANAYAELSVGDVDSSQGIVELSAIKGGLHSFRIHAPGDGYSNANIAVYGDGSGFSGNVELVSNAVSKITVVNPGQNYTYANVVITGNGANANVSAIISPPNGHGSDAVSELFADTLMFYSTINNEKNHGITVNNDYRQFGIIKDIKNFDNNQAFTTATGSACYLLTLDSVTGLAADDILTLTDNNNQARRFEIVEVVASTKQVLVTNRNNYTLAEEDELKNSVLTTFTVVTIDETPSINKLSGDLLYIDNRTTVSYSDQQLVTLRTIIQL